MGLNPQHLGNRNQRIKFRGSLDYKRIWAPQTQLFLACGLTAEKVEGEEWEGGQGPSWSC